MTRDTPPGHRRRRFGSWSDTPPRVGVPWIGEPGDVIVEHGPRLGERYWVVVDVEPLRKWASVLMRRCELDELLAAVDEGAGGWYMWPGFIKAVADVRTVLLSSTGQRRLQP